MDDYTKIQGKIVALAPSFSLMAELTGKPSSATVVGLYTAHFVDCGLAMHDVNVAVEQIMVGWNKPYWPSADDIAKKARGIVSSYGNKDSVVAHRSSLEDAFTAEGERRWEHRLGMANTWRDASPQNVEKFRAIVKAIDLDVVHLRDVVRLEWLQQSSYRDAFRLGASVGGCLRQAGIDERKQQAFDAIHRELRAKRFAHTGKVGDLAA